MRYEIYSADKATNNEIRDEFAGQWLIYDAIALQDISDENGVISFDSEQAAQDYIEG